MFSKALFKQSCKANGTMWCIITFAVCFMLACVMLISGNGNIGEVKNSIQDTLITQEVEAQMQKRALAYYSNAEDGLNKFDSFFLQNSTETLKCSAWQAAAPNRQDFSDEQSYLTALAAWENARPQTQTTAAENYLAAINNWQNSRPEQKDFSSESIYLIALNAWEALSPVSQENALLYAYKEACTDLQAYVLQHAAADGYDENSTEAQEMLGSVMYVLNPNGMFDDFYTENGENAPDNYDIASIAALIATDQGESYISSDERIAYRQVRAAKLAPAFIAGNMIKPENVTALMNALSSYGVTKEKYDSFGYNYRSIKSMSATAIVTYRGRLEYELGLLEDLYASGGFESEEEYVSAISTKKSELSASVSSSFLSTLPNTVSEALEEVGQMDLYTLVVGSIFYKLAGLLLPIIYVIMASNNLVAGQVDSGSMAYVLSTSTKRATVVFTQAVFLVGSVFATCLLTTATGCVCLAIVGAEVGLTYGNLVLLNAGAFLILFALSGLCFLTSCIFDRSKRAMGIGGGLSIFSLVAAMLGLFGSPVIPSVVRLDALNYFNYVTIISLFDVISIIDGTTTFLWKFAILAVLGVLGYVIGSVRFTQKDLPL